jgi:hypothetical protein
LISVHNPSTGTYISACGFTSTLSAASAQASSNSPSSASAALSMITTVSAESLWPHMTVSKPSAGFSATSSIAT